jgi:alanine racemase
MIGDDITLDEVAAKSGTIGYEILVHLGPRFRRRVLTGKD